MQTLDSKFIASSGAGSTANRMKSKCPWTGFVLLVATLAVASEGCKKDVSFDAIETDANGYLCLKCDAKFYTDRKVFMDSKCPKCQQDSVMDVIGYLCSKDHHLTIRPRVSGPKGAAVCEQCGAHLQNAMVSPREKDLKVWGAIKTAPQ